MSSERKLAALLTLLVSAIAGSVHAQAVGEGDAAYREAIGAALGAYDAGDLAKAHELFELANARYPNARALRGLGTVELEQHEYVAATTHLEQALASDSLPLTGSLRQETEAALAEANAHVGRVLVLPSPASARVQLDERAVDAGAAIVLAPGVYALSLSADGFRSESRQLLIVANQSQLVHWSLERIVEVPASPALPSPPAVPPRASRSPWWVVGAGGALAATGIALLAVGVHDYRQLDDARSYADWRGSRDRYPKLLGIGGALIGVGAGAIAGGLWWRRVSFHGDSLTVHY